MKKFLLVFLISAAISFGVKAQSKFSLGPNAGVGGSWITGDNSKSILAANAGLSLVYSATEHFGIGLDAKYSFEGGKFETSNNSSTIDLNYFRIPLKAIYFFNGYGDRLRPKAFVGPSFGFLTSAKVGDVNVKDFYESFDFGVTAGAGLNYRLVKNTWFNADLNYYHGVSDVIKNSTAEASNRNLGVNVGVNFGL